MSEVEFHRAESAETRGEGICRTCCEPIWLEQGTIGGQVRGPDWSDRNERGGDSLVCFKAVQYRHVPLNGREACIYDRAYRRAMGEAHFACCTHCVPDEPHPDDCHRAPCRLCPAVETPEPTS